MSKPIIFLSGGMTGLSDHEACHWRTLFKLENVYNTYTFIDPTQLYFPTESPPDDTSVQNYELEAMKYDLYWVKKADVIVVNFNSLSSIGTAQETMYAHMLGKPIIGMIPKDKYDQLHPWYKEEAIKIFQYEDTEEDLLKTVSHIYDYIYRFVDL